MMGSKAFENPLMSHVRMRAMFRALVETRSLGRHAGKSSAVPKGLEACWVATAIDLRPDDLVSSVQAGWITDSIRGIGRREGAKAATTVEIKRALRSMEDRASVTRNLSPMERILFAMGSGMALRAAGHGAVVVAYAGRSELSANEWKRLLAIADEGNLPILIVATPQLKAKSETDVGAIGSRMKFRNVPVIPVDVGDTLALYRVTQESLVRARADNMAAVIECIDCGSDPVRMMAAQLVKKQVCTENWVNGVEATFRAALAKV